MLAPGMAGAFLDALTETEADDLRAVGRRRTYGANVTLFHQGDEAGPVLVLLDGRVKVVALTPAGREVIVAVRGPGDLLGEMAAFDGEPRSATVATLEPVDALLVPGSAFAAFLERRPRVALVILRMVAGRLRYADAQQADFATHDVVGRVAHRLVELCERFGEPGGGPDRDRAAALAGGARGLDRRLARGGEQGAAAPALAADRRDAPPPRRRAGPRGPARAGALTGRRGAGAGARRRSRSASARAATCRCRTCQTAKAPRGLRPSPRTSPCRTRPIF